MGIYDREYYRGDGPSFLGSITSGGKVCKWLIAINIVAFILQQATRAGRADGPFTDALELNVNAVLRGQVWRLLTYAFLHSPDNLYHILFNMLFLWWFGRDVETIYGHAEFLAMYLAAALVAGLAFVIGYTLGAHGPLAYGASGAVMAVVLICACHDPHRTILLFFLVPVPIWLFVAFAVAKDAFALLGADRGGSVAVTAHLGGAAFGFLYYRFQWRISTLVPDLRGWFRSRSRPALRVYREEEEPAAPVAVTAPARDIDEQLEAKLDAVLAKVAQHGKESLTESEHQVLLKASEVYRRRRT
jgi:membrane associated rhomboid family serine protease